MGILAKVTTPLKTSSFVFTLIITSWLYLTIYDFAIPKNKFRSNVYNLWEPLNNSPEEQYIQFPIEPGGQEILHMPNVLKHEPANNKHFNGTGYKKVLLYNDLYGTPHYYIGLGHTALDIAGCPISNCILSSNRSRYQATEWDAVVWHFRSNDKSLPLQRSSHSRYVFYMMESPRYLFANNLKDYNGIFNWTMTYRRDSTFPHTYGQVFRRSKVLPPLDLHSNIANKTKLAAWFVSNCKSKSRRESLGRALAVHMSIDIYGKCGYHHCSRSGQNDCYKMLERDYKFYLAFENSICDDYITEKFFSILKYNVVPIVYGGGDYAHYAPSNSYINAQDFSSAKELADYLLYLDGNDTAYAEYFEWKRYCRVDLNWSSSTHSWCELCQRLHEDNTTNVVEDLDKWFVEESNCAVTGEQMPRISFDMSSQAQTLQICAEMIFMSILAYAIK